MTNPIGYVDETWNPIVGCSPISEGCRGCWARRMAQRLAANPGAPKEYSAVWQWDGHTRLVESVLDKPLHWKKPRRIAVSFMGDWCHPSADALERSAVIRVMRECEQHTFLTLTKRPENLPRVLPCNVWAGVSVEDSISVRRIDALTDVDAAVRWVSAEPLLRPLPQLTWAGISWVVAGPETGPGARPCDPKWIEDLADQCAAAGVAFWDKRGILRQELPR